LAKIAKGCPSPKGRRVSYIRRESFAGMADDKVLKEQIKDLIIRRLRLEISPNEIDDNAALFEDGLGLDSIDALELVVGLEQEFGISIPDEDVGKEAFASVEALCSYVERHKGK
jgi:acyl carrier protein